MSIHGQLNRVTDLKAFVTSWAKTGGKPTAGHAPWGHARVHLATDFPGGKFGSSMPPAMSLKADADAQGRFKFDTVPAMAAFRGQVLAFDIGSMPSPIPNLPPLPVLTPFYRSAPFKFSDVSAAEGAAVQPIYVFKATTPTELGVSQEELDAQMGTLKKALKLDKLRANIASAKVNVSASKQGGELKFAAFVRGSTAADLDRIIDVKAGEIDIDLPGPDFIVGLCVDKDDIEAQIRKGLSQLSLKVSKSLLDELDKQMPALSSLASATVWRTRHVQTGARAIKLPGGVPDVQVPVFAVVPDAAFGVPRKLF